LPRYTRGVHKDFRIFSPLFITEMKREKKIEEIKKKTLTLIVGFLGAAGGS
jgi:hypothetical protein